MTSTAGSAAFSGSNPSTRLAAEEYTRSGPEERVSAGAACENMHPGFIEDFNDEEIANTLRIYNSHLSRIEVMHYRDLIDNAERSLALAAGQSSEGSDEATDPSVV